MRSQDIQDMYGVKAEWGDQDSLLRGFKYNFLKNYSPSPSYLKWPHGLMNFGIFNEIRRERPHAVVLMSWMNFTWWAAMLASQVFKIPFLFLTDANIQGDLSGNWWKRAIKSVLLGKIVFRLASGFLYAGTANKELYQKYDVNDSKLIPFAYSWGYESFMESSQNLRSSKGFIRDELGIPRDKYVILYSGRLSQEKSPMDILAAYELLDVTNKALVFVGDGQLRAFMESYVSDKRLESVYFAGFQNRNEISKYYALADVLVLPSRRETWGMVINEALCFGLPVVASEEVGAVKDLVFDGYNGYLFPYGDVEKLAYSLKNLSSCSDEDINLMQNRSMEIMSQWTGRDLLGYLYEFCYGVWAKQEDQS